LKEYGEKIDDSAKNKIDAAVNRLKEALKSENLDEIKSATEALNQVWSESASTLYQQAGAGDAQAGQQPGGQAGGETTDEKSDEKVEEADYEVVDEEKENKNKNKK
jgi:molecular chaperone DnaK